MSRTRTAAAITAAPARTDTRELPATPVDVAAEVATVLAAMTYEERVRAYRSGALSVHELAIAAARLPEEMPTLNGEYEWIAINVE